MLTYKGSNPFSQRCGGNHVFVKSMKTIWIETMFDDIFLHGLSNMFKFVYLLTQICKTKDWFNF